MKAIKTFSALLLVFIAAPCIAMALEWQIETVDSEGDVGGFTSLSLDSSDYPHISYLDDTNDDLKYAYFDGSSWNIETVDSEGNVGYYTFLSLDSGDYPHISYHDWSNGDLKYAYFDGSSWNIETVDSEGGMYSSLSLDSGDYPHISYYDSSYGDLKYAYFDGSSWNIETVDSKGDVGMYSSLSLDSSDHPYISYYKFFDFDLKYAYFDGSSWNIETVDSEGDVGMHSSLSLDSGDHPHISYWDYITNHDLKYAYYDGSSWNIETVDSEGSVGNYTSLFLDSSDYPHISYWDYGNYDLKYAYYDGSSWNIETVDSEVTVGNYTSLSLDSGDYPHISYYDQTNGDLKYAYAYSPVVPPTVTGVTPQSRGQGATGQDIVVTGADFMDGAVVSFSGDGITVNSTTFVSSTELIANIDIAADATVGVRDVIVTNPDEQTGTGEDMFSVTAAPTVSGTEPSSLPQGATEDVTIFGSGFVDNPPDDPNGPQLAADFSDGITVNSVTFVSETELTANISIADDAALGDRDVTVVNGDAGVGIGVGIFTVVEPSELTLVCKTDKPIYNPWESVQVLADVDNPGAAFDANLLGGIIVVRTPPKKPFILKGEVVTETIDPGLNSDILLYTSKPIITAIAPKVTHGAFSVLYTEEAGILAIDTSIWGLTAPPEVAQEKFFDNLIRSYIDKYGVENLQNANAEDALASPANVPLKTALSSAFPNAANPETWFPFQISEASEVKIEIYNASGRLVKTLDLGYKDAGYYLNKEKAAFWNGRNDRGERVASGIYYYTMKTRNFTATKKVVILK